MCYFGVEALSPLTLNIHSCNILMTTYKRVVYVYMVSNNNTASTDAAAYAGSDKIQLPAVTCGLVAPLIYYCVLAWYME